MQTVTVIPIKKGIGTDTLTYFTNQDIAIGSVVSIPIRNKESFGLVVETKEVKDIKSEIKNLPYGIRKINKGNGKKIFLNSFIKSCEKVADYAAASLGSTIYSLLPQSILESPNLQEATEGEIENFYETQLLQTETEERYATYRSIIREEFAKNRSVFFCLPTTEDILNSKNTLEKGIEPYTYIFHGGLSKKDMETKWNEVVQNPHPVLIIGTGSFLSIPRKDIGVIILDKESSRGYKMQARPFLDIRHVAETIAKETKTKIIFGDILLRVETLWKEKSGKYTALAPLKFRSLTSAKCEIIQNNHSKDMKKKEFSLLSPELKAILEKTKENNERTFVFCGRKGMYPITVCSDCGTTVACKNCKAPIVLYGKKEGVSKHMFVCNHCGERRVAEELCVHCNGWRLTPLGIGTEKIKEEILTLFPGMAVFVMDKDNVKTHKQAVKMRDAFYSTPGSVLIGTEMAISYLNQELENSAVASIDSYFSIPDFQINEKIFHILLEMRALTQRNFLIQTRQEPDSFGLKIFEYAVRGNLLDFYKDEIADRKNIGYPPFALYIKITTEGEKLAVKKNMESVALFLKPHELSIFPGWRPGGDAKYTGHGLISMEEAEWVNRDLLRKLRELPLSFAIKVNPSSLL
ncbi:MAG: hypothetical protein V4690_00630 [Patescibacteria group bacterium]